MARGRHLNRGPVSIISSPSASLPSPYWATGQEARPGSAPFRALFSPTFKNSPAPPQPSPAALRAAPWDRPGLATAGSPRQARVAAARLGREAAAAAAAAAQPGSAARFPLVPRREASRRCSRGSVVRLAGGGLCKAAAAAAALSASTPGASALGSRARLPRRLCPRPARQPSRLGAAPAMSHVRLSNGSPTLERMEARQADYPKPSACRNLFGPVDHDELARELERQHRDLAEASRRKWNFDFQRHQPLDGRYEWQAVAHDALPDFYTRPPRLRGAPAKPDGRCRPQGRAAPEEPPRSAAAEAPREPAAQGAGPRKRPAADPDDSSHQNKRANTTEVISEDSPSNYSVEQTPKKSSPRRHQT